MEIITFTNAHEDEMIFSEVADYKLVSRSGFGASDIVPQLSPAYGINGQIYRGSKFGVRYLRIRFSIEKKTEAAFQTACRDVLSTLNPLIGEGLIQYESNGSKYRIDAIVVDGPVPVAQGQYSGVYEVVFLCTQPLFEDDTESSVSDDIPPMTRLYSFAFNNTGDVETPFIIELNGIASAGSTIALDFSEVAFPPPPYTPVGDFIDVVLTLDWYKLTIDTDPRRIQVVGETELGAQSSLFNAIGIQTTFFQLPVGENNIKVYLKILVNNVTPITIKWRNRYVGVTL